MVTSIKLRTGKYSLILNETIRLVSENCNWLMSKEIPRQSIDIIIKHHSKSFLNIYKAHNLNLYSDCRNSGDALGKPVFIDTVV